MIFSSNVKVNIGLFINSVRSDGYHNISTIFQELNIGDSIDIQKTNSQFMIKSNNDSVPLDKSNTFGFLRWSPAAMAITTHNTNENRTLMFNLCKY